MANKTTALITAACSELGREFCRQLAERCDVIIAAARRESRLQELKNELSDRVEVHAIVADLATVEGVARTIEALRQKGPVDYLINNAGMSTYGLFAEQGIDVQCLCPGLVGTEFHSSEGVEGVQLSAAPDTHWGEAVNIVSASLTALGGGRR